MHTEHETFIQSNTKCHSFVSVVLNFHPGIYDEVQKNFLPFLFVSLICLVLIDLRGLNIYNYFRVYLMCKRSSLISVLEIRPWVLAMMTPLESLIKSDCFTLIIRKSLLYILKIIYKGDKQISWILADNKYIAVTLYNIIFEVVNPIL